MTTKRFNKRMLASIFGSGLACLAVNPAHARVIIHSDGFTENNELLPNNPNYGSNVTVSDANITAQAGAHGIVGAPDISLTWIGTGGTQGFGFESYTNWDGRGSVIQLDMTSDGSGQYQIVFTPQNGAAVRIESFDLDLWAGGGTVQVDWRIEGNGGILASGTWMRNTGGRDTITPAVTGSANETLTLHFDHLQGLPSYLAMDNLVFDQLVPEPASATLVVAGIGAMAMRRRRMTT